MSKTDNRQHIFLYPGQGAQYVGMGRHLFQTFALAREMFERTDDSLGFSLSRLCIEGPEEVLNQDLNAQLSVYTISCIITDILKSQQVGADVVSGYSAGFYGAAYAAGCFCFEHGLEIVRRAGGILLEAGSRINGSMALIFGLSREEVASICETAGRVETAIFNTRRQIVISGLTPAVQHAVELAKKAGALDAYMLPAETAYHSSFMASCSQKLRQEISDLSLSPPAIDIISYTSLKKLITTDELIEMMAVQLSRPVFWVNLISELRQRYDGFWFEIGPGQIISRTVRWIDRHVDMINTDGKDELLAVVDKFGFSPL